MSEIRFYATGKRKTAVARVWLVAGTGNITVNKKALDEYFDVDTARITIERPFVLTETLGRFDVMATVKGGGKCAQSEAIRHGIAKALVYVNEELRPVLKRAGLLTRDARVKERKKYGLAGARKRYQYSKR